MKALKDAVFYIEAGLVDHAARELELAGVFDEDSDYNGAIGRAVMELIETFADQGHSGASADFTLSVFDELARHRPLSPVTDDPDEWEDVAQYGDGSPFWQNKRDSRFFSEDGGKTWWNVDTL
jgi:hypothetical protein